jgi:DnaJ-class molecular chaperone
MSTVDTELSVSEARFRLGLDADAPLSELQGAFQRALKTARGTGEHVSAEQYREILHAYRVLRNAAPVQAGDDRRFEVWPSQIELTPAEAIAGGMKVGRLPTGRPFETKIPPSLRDGDLVWVWGWLLQVKIDHGEALAVRGDDIWITARKHPSQLKPGARIAVETPLGPVSFRLSKEAVEAGLARAPGLGLPPSRGHAQGDLYVRLVSDRRVGGPAELIKRLTPRRAA